MLCSLNNGSLAVERWRAAFVAVDRVGEQRGLGLDSFSGSYILLRLNRTSRPVTQ